MKYFWVIVFTLLGSAGVFMIVSLALSSVHGVGLVEEWKTWFALADAGKEVLESVARNVIKI